MNSDGAHLELTHISQNTAWGDVVTGLCKGIDKSTGLYKTNQKYSILQVSIENRYTFANGLKQFIVDVKFPEE